MRSTHPRTPGTRPVLVQFSSLGIWASLAIVMGPLVPSAHAVSSVTASGAGAHLSMSEGVSISHSLTISANDSGDHGSWTANASALGPRGSTDDPSKNVRLRATASANLVNIEAADETGVQARATAHWSDQLRFENPDVLDLQAYTAFFVFFLPTVDGTTSGAATGRFEVAVDDEFESIDFLAPNDFSESVTFRIPAIDLRGGAVPFVMNLIAAATARYDGPTSSVADFGSTAELPTLILADANGNYVPGTEQLRIVGDSGFQYSTRAVPEPSSLALLAVAGIVAFAMRRKRTCYR